jgi:hypothetical protein
MEKFIELVASMRTAQTEYFRTKSYDALKKAKELESQVDEAIRLKDQLRLF